MTTDTQEILRDLDAGFLGVNNRLDPGAVAVGYVAHALNRRFDRGTVRNRWNVVRPQWGGGSGKSSLTIELTAGSTTAYGAIVPPPMEQAHIAGDDILPGTVVTDYTGNPLTADSTLISADSTLFTADATGEITLSRPPPVSNSMSVAHVAGNALPFDGQIVGVGRFMDPESGGAVILQAVDAPRADGGQGQIWASQPGYIPQEISLNGHDLNGTVRFIQAFNGMVLLRQGRARFYFLGSEIAANVISLHVTPAFETGTRVTFVQVIEEDLTLAAPLGTLISGNNYWARVFGDDVTLHASEADARSGAGEITIPVGVAEDRYYLERNDQVDVVDVADRNNGVPLLMQPTLSQREPLANGFDAIPLTLEAVSADSDLDTVTIENHRLVTGDRITLSQQTGGLDLSEDGFYVAVLDPHTVRLFADQLDAMGNSDDGVEDLTATGTAVVRKAGSGGGPMPPGREGVYLSNRLWLVWGRDFMVASDILDPLSCQPISSEYRANSGTDDAIVCLAPFNETTIVIFKERSILALQNVYGDLSSLQLVEITREFGCLAPLSVAATGSDLVFLSQRGVATIRQTAEGMSQSVVVPLSETIPEYVDAIAWRGVSASAAAYFDNRYILAAPGSDGDEGNSYLLVYNFLNKAWEGVWSGDYLRPDAWVQAMVSGRLTLCWADRSGYLHYFSTGLQDQLADGTQVPIQTVVSTRGYRAGVPVHKRFIRVQFECATWNPTFSVSALMDGSHETFDLCTARTRDRTRYLVVGSGIYDTGNALDDFARPYRQDYSLIPGFRCGSGVVASQHQHHYVKLQTGRRTGSYIQVEISTTTGQVEIAGVLVEAVPHRDGGFTDN